MRTIDGIHEYHEGDIQYPFADVGDIRLMHISRINQENRRTYRYVCPYCKKEMLPRLGSNKKHCFAHKAGMKCDMDRYIHTTAIRLLKEKWDREEPFEIKMTVNRRCREADTCVFYDGNDLRCVKKETKTYDLKESYDRCVVEKKVGDFIPDLCLMDDTGRHKPIFIEIWNKHKNSEKKAHSGNKIIEIRLKNVEGLEELTKYPITESKSVTFSHFDILEKKPTKEEGIPLIRYTLYSDTLKSFVDKSTVYCVNYKNSHHPKSVFEVVCRLDDIKEDERRFRKYCNALAIEHGYDIRSPYLCKHYGKDDRNQDYRSSYDINGPSGCCRDLETCGLLPCNQEKVVNCKHFQMKGFTLRKWKGLYFNMNCYIWIKDDDGTTSEEVQRRKDIEEYWLSENTL